MGPKSKVWACAMPGFIAWAKPMPPNPEFQGSSAARAKAVATAASAAVPPASSISAPASAAALTWETTMPPPPRAAGFRSCQFWVTCGAGKSGMSRAPARGLAGMVLPRRDRGKTLSRAPAGKGARVGGSDDRLAAALGDERLEVELGILLDMGEQRGEGAGLVAAL